VFGASGELFHEDCLRSWAEGNLDFFERAEDAFPTPFAMGWGTGDGDAEGDADGVGSSIEGSLPGGRLSGGIRAEGAGLKPGRDV
jgi:hypothetical protein